MTGPLVKAWVIEFHDPQNGPVWYGPNLMGIWRTKEKTEAIRFAREVDAQRFILAMGPGWWGATAETYWFRGDEVDEPREKVAAELKQQVNAIVEEYLRRIQDDVAAAFRRMS